LNQIVFLVRSSPQTQVTPLSCADNFIQRFFVGVGNHQGTVLRPQQTEHIIVEPGFVPELKSGWYFVWQQIEKGP